MDQNLLKPEPKILDAWGWCRSPKFQFRLQSPGSNYCEPCPWLFICKFFKAVCNLVSLSHMAFPPVLLIWRRLRYLMCSYLVETCSATYFVGNFISNISLTLHKTSGKRSLHSSKRLNIRANNKIWHRLHHRFGSRWKVLGCGIAFADVS